MSEKHAAVFMDRDGTINEDAGYIDRLERFELYPFAVDANAPPVRARPAAPAVTCFRNTLLFVSIFGFFYCCISYFSAFF